MNGAVLWTGQWITKLLDFLFWIGLQAASRGCRNLLRTSEREGATGTEPRIRTVRQLTAAAGDGLLGSVGSPGQLETSLNSGYQWAPATHTWRGPHPFVWACCSRNRAWNPPPSSSLAEEERLCSLLLRAAARDFARRSQSISGVRRRVPFPYSRSRCAICRRSQPRGVSLSDRAARDLRLPAASGTSSSRQRAAQRGSARCCRRDRGSG
jgi:hypothetical protein